MIKLLTLTICLFTSVAFSQQYNWVRWDTFPSPYYQYKPDVTVASNGVYIYGTCQLNNITAAGVKYNPVAKTWVPIQAFTTDNRNACISFYYNGLFYRGFGSDSQGNYYNDLFKTDMPGNAWQPAGEIADTNIGGGFTFQINDRIYLGGCNISDTATNTFYNQPGTPIWKYDPAAQTFTNVSTYPKHSIELYIFNNGSRLFMGGGVSSGNSTYSSNYELNLQNYTWTEKAPLPGWVSYSPGGYFTRGDFGYVYCGNGQDSTGFTLTKPQILQYDMINDLWAITDTFPYDFTNPMYHFKTDNSNDEFFGSLVEDNSMPGGFRSELFKYTNHIISTNVVAYFDKNGIVAYPNPAPTGNPFTLVLPFENKECTYLLNDISGKEYLIDIIKVDSKTVKLRPTVNLSKGIYFLQVINSGKIYPIKLFVD